MILREITLDNKSDLEFVEKLYIESFPRNERRPLLEMHRLLVDEYRFNVSVLINDSDIRVGFISFWTFDSFIYLEHFAIDSGFRNNGYGKQVLQMFIDKTKLPLVGEIELPEASDLAKRRFMFYQKRGFHVWDNPYQQPPYEDGLEPLSMRLISYREIDFDAVCEVIYTNVYKIRKYTNDC